MRIPDVPLPETVGDMANPEHVEMLKKAVKEWNAWRLAHPEARTDLSGADLRGANLTSANLSHARLTFANLWEAVVTGVNWQEAELPAGFVPE